MVKTPLKILLVEDSPDDAFLFQDLLSELGSMRFQVRHVMNLTEALKAINDEPFDVVFLDLGLPESRGVKTFFRIKEEARDLVVIVLSGLHDSETALTAVKEGAQDYLVKGEVTPSLLQRSIQYGIERKKNQVALLKSEERFRRVFQSSLMGILILELGRHDHFIIRDINPAAAATLKLEARDVIGKEMRHIFPAHPVGEELERVREIAREGGSLRLETDYADERISGVFEMNVFQTAPRTITIMFQDNTERHNMEMERLRLEQHMRQTQKLESLGVLAGGIAHDFNNLLMGVLGNSELLSMELASDSFERKIVEKIESAAWQAADLSASMLAYSGKGSFALREMDLGQLVLSMRSLIDSSISRKGRLELNLPSRLPAIMADPNQIRQVILNLVTNASEALEEKAGMISISVDSMQAERDYLARTFVDDHLAGGSYVYLEVMDTGKGMEPEMLEKIFDPFFSTNFTGRGLGLAVVLGIVRGHKGAVKVSSEPGHGSTFRVLFPALDRPCQEERLSPQQEEEPLRGSGTILLVDDEAHVLEVTRHMLERFGYHVETAMDGAEAVTEFEKIRGQVFCVLLDVTMPHMNVGHVTQTMREMQPKVPILLASGYARENLEDQLALSQYTDFLQKPYRFSVLSKMLKNLQSS